MTEFLAQTLIIPMSIPRLVRQPELKSTLKFGNLQKTGLVINCLLYTSGKTGTEIVKEINDKLGLIDGAEHAEAMVGINTYAQGVTYYIARVKHFGSLTCLLYTSHQFH